MIVFVDDSQDLCDLVIQLLDEQLGVRCLAFISMAAMISHSADALASRAVILDINLGPDQPDGLDLFTWLQRNEYQGQVLFLTGHGSQHPRVLEAGRTGVTIMEKPIPTKEFLNFVHTAIVRSRARAGQ